MTNRTISRSGAKDILSPNYVSPNTGYSIAIERSLKLTGLANDPNIHEDKVAKEYWNRLHKAIGKSAKTLHPAQKLGPYGKYRPVSPAMLKMHTVNEALTADLIAGVSSRKRQRVVRELVLTLHEILRIRQGVETPLFLNGIDGSIHDPYAAARDGRPDNSFISKPYGSCGPIKQDAYDVYDAFQIMDRTIKGVRDVRPVNMSVDAAVVMFRRGGDATPPKETQSLNVSLHNERVMPLNVIASEATIKLIREGDVVGSYSLAQAINTESLDSSLGIVN